jgi:Predicted Na+-dependent transporter
MFKKLLAQQYIIIAVIAILAGIFLPSAKYLISWNTLILQVIFFLSCLKIDLKTVLSHFKDWKMLTLANLLMLIIFPLVVWLISSIHPTDFGFALFLLAAMPVGMTAPLLAEVGGGIQSIAMVLTATTSLLAPFTVPLLTKIFYGANVSVNATSMFTQLALVIFIPFAIAMIIRSIIPKTIGKIKDYTKPLSLILLGLLIAGAVAKQSAAITQMAGSFWVFLGTIIALYVFFLIVHLIGYFSFYWEKREIKQTTSVSLAYMNFTLAIFLASQFFPKPQIILPLVLSIIPWATFMPIWRRIIKQ